MACLRWLGSVFLVSSLFAAPTEAAYGFGDYEYERNMVEYYSAHKLLTKCYGNGTIDDWQKYIDHILFECTNSYRPEFHEYFDGSSEEYLVRKQQPFFTKQKLKHLVNEIGSHIEQLECFFDRLKLEVCSSGYVVGKPLKDYVNGHSMDEVLKTELLEEIEFCERDSRCGDFSLLGRPYVNFFKLVKFYKCWQDARLKTCVKHDITMEYEEYDLAGLKNFATDLDVAHREVFITSAYFADDNKYGGLWQFW